MKTALVTGSNGFVGRHMVRELHSRGYVVHGVDNLSTGLPFDHWPRGLYGQHSYFDILEIGDLREFLSYAEGPYDLIVHCAAIVGGRSKIEGDPLAVATDLSIDAEFFNWVVRLDPQPKKVVYFSSSAIYPTLLQTRGTHCHLSEAYATFDTERFGMPDMTYGWAKLTGEYLARVAVIKHNLPVVIYRPFSGYGEDQDMAYPFPAIVRRVLDGENPVTVWGSGDQQRDWIHIDDIVAAVFASMDAMKHGEVLNLGSGIGTSFRHLIASAHQLIHPNVSHLDIRPDRTKPEGVFSRVADTYNMERYYKPRITLDEGIRRVAAHLDKARQTV